MFESYKKNAGKIRAAGDMVSVNDHLFWTVALALFVSEDEEEEDLEKRTVRNDKKPEPNDEKKMLIVCYRKPYSGESRQYIEELLEEEEIDKVIIVRISEARVCSKQVSNFYIGQEVTEDLQEELVKDDKIRIWRYSEDIYEICEELGIPTEKVLERGDAGNIIPHLIRKYQPCCTIIHRSDKSWFDKYLSGSVMENVLQESKGDLTILR